MIRILCLAASIALCLVGASTGAQAAQRALDTHVLHRWVAVSASDIAMRNVRPDDGLRISCRRKVRRAYGPVRGRHAGSLRIAFIEQCVANDGRVV